MQSDGTTRLDASEDASDHIRARVAWYYFNAGMTQQEIASRLGMTRLRVNKLLGQMRTDGSVVVDIRMPLTDCVALEERLKTRFGLVDAVVVPAVDDDRVQQRMIGEAAGRVLDPLLKDGQGLGVGWGRTLSQAVRRITPRRFTNSWVGTLMGGLTRGSGTNTFEVSSAFAHALGAECFYLAAPMYLPSAESREELAAHYGIAETFAQLRRADIALVSCGDLTDRSMLITTNTVSRNLDGLRALGAVGDLLGVFLDADGHPIDHPLNRRSMSMSPAELKAIPDAILASGGRHKAGIVRAVLKAGYINRVVTDEACATAII